MCAIIDANVSPEVFGDDRTPRGKILYDWLTRGRTGRLVVGGELLRELSQYGKFKAWLSEAISAGRARRVMGCRRRFGNRGDSGGTELPVQRPPHPRLGESQRGSPVVHQRPKP